MALVTRLCIYGTEIDERSMSLVDKVISIVAVSASVTSLIIHHYLEKLILPFFGGGGGQGYTITSG